MTFQLQAVSAWGHEVDEPLVKHFQQWVKLSIVAANTDTALDIASDTTGSLGTFWTAVIADATYGSVGSTALQIIQTIQGFTPTFEFAAGPVIQTYVKVLSGAAGNQYTTSITANVPSFAFVSGSAPTANTLYLVWDLPNGVHPVKYPIP